MSDIINQIEYWMSTINPDCGGTWISTNKIDMVDHGDPAGSE